MISSQATDDRAISGSAVVKGEKALFHLTAEFTGTSPMCCVSRDFKLFAADSTRLSPIQSKLQVLPVQGEAR